MIKVWTDNAETSTDRAVTRFVLPSLKMNFADS